MTIKGSKYMKLPKAALACAAALAAFALNGLAPLPAKAGSVYLATWIDGPTAPSPTNGTGGAGECLGVLGGNMTNGTAVVVWTCNGHPDQTWEIINGFPGSGGFMQIHNSQDPSKCLGVLGSATSDGSNLVIWDCNNHSDQLWQFVPWNGDPISGPFGCYNIVNLNADPKVLGVLNGGTPTDGAQAVIWDPLTGFSHRDQVWCP